MNRRAPELRVIRNELCGLAPRTNPDPSTCKKAGAGTDRDWHGIHIFNLFYY